jgi:hypothetical protein
MHKRTVALVELMQGGEAGVVIEYLVERAAALQNFVENLRGKKPCRQAGDFRKVLRHRRDIGRSRPESERALTAPFMRPK